MPRALPEALIEGLVWDAMERRYNTFDELVAYSARVASAVGVMMCVIMRQRDSNVLARACDLGVAMQLTNIARDIGEDAREGRLYIPLNWMKEVGVNPNSFLTVPAPTPEIRELTHRLLSKAEILYQRSESGIVAYQKLSGQPCFLHVTFTQQLDRKFETINMIASLFGLKRRGQKS